MSTTMANVPFCRVPTYLGVKLDRSPTFRHHLEASRKKLTTRVALMRRLAGSGWGAGAKTLRTAALSLVYSTAEYCAPVWCRSAHTRLIDSVLNDALSLDACVQLQQTIYPSSQVSSPLSFADWEQRSPWHIVAAWTLVIFSMNYWLGPHTATERD